MKKSTSTIDSILNNYSPDQVSAPALKAALKKHKKQKEEEEAEKLLDNLKTIDRVMNTEVQRLRDLRKKEEAQRKRVVALNAAKEQYLKDGNWQNFYNAYHNAIHNA